MEQLNGEIGRFTVLQRRVIEARSGLASLQGQAEILKTRLSGRTDAGALRNELDAHEARLGPAEEALEALRRKYDETRTAKTRAEDEASRLEEGIAGLQRLGARCSLCGHELTREHLAQQEEERQNLLDAARSDAKELAEAQRGQGAEIREAEAGVRGLKDVMDSLSRDLLPGATEYGRLSADAGRLRDELRGLDAENVVPEEPNFGGVAGRTPVEYLSALKDALAEHENAERRASEMRDEMARLSADAGRLRDELRGLDAENVVPEEPNFGGVAGRTPVEYLSALKDALAEHENAERRASEMRDEMARLEAANRQSRGDLAKSRERLRALESDLGRVTARLGSYAGDDEAASAVRRRLDGIRESLRGVRDDLAAGRANLANESARIERLEPEIASAERWQRLHRIYAGYVDWLADFFVPTISRIEKDVLVSLRQSFNESYRKWYGSLVDDPTKDSHINEEFAPVVHQDGYDQKLEYLSGGEKASVALAYRLALNFVMRQETRSLESNLLILDEPTDGFSRDQLSNVRGLLDGLQSRQIILVSHDDELKSRVDHAFHVSKSSGITTVSAAPAP